MYQKKLELDVLEEEMKIMKLMNSSIHLLRMYLFNHLQDSLLKTLELPKNKRRID